MACLHISTIWSWVAAIVGLHISVEPTTLAHTATAKTRNVLSRSDMLPLRQPRLSIQILEANHLDSKLAQIGLGFSMRVKEFAWVAQRVGLEHRKKESNISAVTVKLERE
jgi:hypothetical protein